MKRVWFNHWFSTAYHLINMMREGDPEDFTFIGSNYHSTCIYRQTCDEWFTEEENISPDDYVDFAAQFCREHHVDVFVPRRGMPDIVRRLPEFDSLGVRVLADRDAAVVAMLDDKVRTYDFFAERMPGLVPPYRLARSLEEFAASCEALKDVSSRVCYKLTEDEGARSFRVLDNTIEQGSALLNKPGMKITPAAAFKVLESYDFSTPILLMPYLGDVEISVDCLATAQGKMIIPRYKTNKRYSEVIFGEEVMAECSRIMDLLGLEMPLNIQYKMSGGRRYLLEINPRMSGGLQLSCKASGLNMPSVAINKLLGRERAWSYPDKKCQRVAHIETPICLD